MRQNLTLKIFRKIYQKTSKATSYLIPSKLTSSQKQSLRLMQRENKDAQSRFQPGPGDGWSKLVKEFRDTMHREGISDVPMQHYNTRFGAMPPGSATYYYIACNLMLNNLKKRDKYKLIQTLKASQSSEIQNHEIELDGLHVSWDLLTSLHAILGLIEVDASFLKKPVNFCDLGAGWGKVGNCLLRLNSEITYVDVDLPESLLVAQNYLPKTLGQVNVKTFEDWQQNPYLPKSGLCFVGPQNLMSIPDKAFQYFINIASFQEMTNSQVEGYLSDIDRLCSGVFYTRQIKHSNFKDGFLISGEKYYPFPDRWKVSYVRDIEEWPGYFEAAFRLD